MNFRRTGNKRESKKRPAASPKTTISRFLLTDWGAKAIAGFSCTARTSERASLVLLELQDRLFCTARIQEGLLQYGSHPKTGNDFRPQLVIRLC